MFKCLRNCGIIFGVLIHRQTTGEHNTCGADINTCAPCAAVRNAYLSTYCLEITTFYVNSLNNRLWNWILRPQQYWTDITRQSVPAPLHRLPDRRSGSTVTRTQYLCWMFLERSGRAGPGNRVWPPEFRLHFSCKPKENTAPVSQARGALWELWPWLPFGSGVSVTWMRETSSECLRMNLWSFCFV